MNNSSKKVIEKLDPKKGNLVKKDLRKVNTTNGKKYVLPKQWMLLT